MQPPRHGRTDLQRVARQAMLDKGLAPSFDDAVREQLQAITGPAHEAVTDLRALLWCSIDNDDSKDLDQLSVAEPQAGGAVKMRVAIADVDALVPRGSPIDRHAAQNTTTVYTGAQIFPMLPERLSTDLTSLNPATDRVVLVIEFVVAADGTVSGGAVSRGLVRNQAQLAYRSVAAWLDGEGALPPAAAAVAGMDQQLKVQDAVGAAMRAQREASGALEFESIEPRPVFSGEQVVGLAVDGPNRAKQLIAELMIAANQTVAHFLDQHGSPSLRRVVRAPERWAKIVGVAAEYGERLPAQPDSAALETFLARRRQADPLRFPDLSLVIVKLMGRGEYVAQLPGDKPVGHFGLAVRDYAHSTAPNRRFPDLVTQRLIKAALARRPPPYGGDLVELASHCSLQESNVTKVERQVRKSAAALLLEGHVGQRFDGVVTGASEKGTFVRVFDPPAEGRVVHGFERLRVGDEVRVTLVGTNFERGFIDFERAPLWRRP